MYIRETRLEDISEVLALYKRVSTIPGGLARLTREIDEEYVNSFLSNTVANGLGYLIFDDNIELVGEIHAYVPNIVCFSHVLSDLTIAVDPGCQGAGVGRLIFNRFMKDVVAENPEIIRIELVARESNKKAIRFYESMGFNVEGKLASRIKNLDGSVEADIPMAWVRV